MIKIALDLLMSRKKWLILIVGSLALMLAGTIAIFCASEIIKVNLEEAAYNNYGEHSGVLLGSEASKKEFENEVDEVGEYAISDSLLLSDNKKVTVGWFDQDAIKLGRIQLSEGNLPKNKNEIAIEESYKKLIDKELNLEWQIGESKIINFKNGQREVTLVGIVKDYSSKWSIPDDMVKGENDFPNIITKRSKTSLHNYLFKINDNKEDSITKSTDLININDEGFINSKLFYNGLTDYDTISTLSFIFQYILLVMSLIIEITLISFYNIKDMKRMAILKAVGASNKDILKVKTYQYMIMLGLGFLCAIPIAILFTLLIIKNTYDNRIVNDINWIYIIILSMSNLIIIAIFLIIKNSRDLKQLNKYSIASLIKGVKIEDGSLKFNLNNFSVRQLFLQVTNYKKISILTTLSLGLTLLLLLMSIFVQKETAGIWDGDIDYFITAQEVYYTKDIDNMVVLKEEGLTISQKDVKRIEKLPYVIDVEKTPFMVDVNLLIDKANLTTPIEDWMKFNNSNAEFSNKLIIPNVNYQIIDATTFNEIYPNKSFEDFKEKAILIIPTNSSYSNKSIIDKEISFVRKFNGEQGLETMTWNYPIYDVIDSDKKTNQGFTVLLDSESAAENGIFRGYIDLSIFTNKNLNHDQKMELESILTEIVSTTPGSLYQVVSDFKIEDMRISTMFGFLGKFSFIITLILAIIGILTIIIGKYDLKKIQWGIYMSLGMTRRQVVRYLSLEIFLYLMIGSLLCGLIFLFIVVKVEHQYPLSEYINYYFMTIGFISLLLLVAISFIKIRINRTSIFQLLRRDD